MEELNSEPALQLPDRLRERRLRDVQALGRASEMPLLGHGQEVAQEPKLDSLGA